MHLQHRVWVEISDLDTWYKIIHEARDLYGNHNWRGQSRVRRKIENNWTKKSVRVWFDVPDANFATWVSVKHGVIAKVDSNK